MRDAGSRRSPEDPPAPGGRLKQFEVFMSQPPKWPEAHPVIVIKCDLIYAVDREELMSRKGRVSAARRAPIVRTIIGAHDWAAVLTSSVV